MQSSIMLLNGLIFFHFFEKHHSLDLKKLKAKIPVKREDYCLCPLGDNKELQLFGFYN